MIKECLFKNWAYYQRTVQTDLSFEDWVNSLSNLELIEYIEAALKETGDDN